MVVWALFQSSHILYYLSPQDNPVMWVLESSLLPTGEKCGTERSATDPSHDISSSRGQIPPGHWAPASSKPTTPGDPGPGKALGGQEAARASWQHPGEGAKSLGAGKLGAVQGERCRVTSLGPRTRGPLAQLRATNQRLLSQAGPICCGPSSPLAPKPPIIPPHTHLSWYLPGSWSGQELR